MVMRYDFLYYLLDDLKFKNVNGICLISDSYLNELVNLFNNLDYRKYFKYNNNLTLENAKFSLNTFFYNLNLGYYDLKLKYGVVTWKIDDSKNIIVGYDNPKSNYNYGKIYIDKEYLKEWKEYGYYFYKE